jgi:hypothetical protein
MSAQLSLSPEETALIEANRVAEAARIQAEEAAETARAAKHTADTADRLKRQRVKLIEHLEAKAEMARALENADTNNVLDFGWTNHPDTNSPMCTISYDLGNKRGEVRIEEHIVRQGNWSTRETTKGYKYEIEEIGDSFKTRKFKNVKTLLERIVHFQEIARGLIERKKSTSDLTKNTMALLKTKYPTADIKAYEPSKYADHCSQWDITYHVTMPKGSVVFRSNLKDGVVTLLQHKVIPSTELLADMADQILKS